MNHPLFSPFLAALIFAAGVSSATTPKPQSFTPISLRGYGTLSGEFTPSQLNNQAVSVLKISCESQNKAQIVQAKYSSDLQLLPGVTPLNINVSGKRIPVSHVDGQGYTSSARTDSTVWILTAPSTGVLTKLESQTLPIRTAIFAPEVPVPTTLDRWDRFGFRFGCRPLEPPKGSTFRKYDQNQEFDWVAQKGRGDWGYVFWDWTDHANTAEGYMADHFWNWGYKAARDRGLSVEINLAAGFGHGTQLWLANRYPQEMSQRMPGYVGSGYDAESLDGGVGYVSWNSGIAWDDQLAELQQTVRRFKGDSTIVGWQEPHSELRHNAEDTLREYGPAADVTYRRWLREKYKTLDAVAQRWAMPLHSWNDVHVPELASFLGWGPGALDLTGPWRVSWLDQSALPTQPKQPIAFPTETFAADFDDSKWPEVILGNDLNMYLPKHKPGVFRRTFDVPAAWLRAHPKVWLDMFDLNDVWGQHVIVTLNGTQVGNSLIRPYYAHSDSYDVTAALKPGTNKLAVALPSGFIAYRVYLSGSEPHEYPQLGAGSNARWADFVDWADDSRVDSIRRAVEMIRQVDPDRDIYLASPGGGASGLTSLAKDYGCSFHDTGGMTGSWGDYLPSLMAGAGLPCALEPGNGFLSAGDVPAFLGHWSTEGLQSIDYIQTVGETYLHPDIRANFEDHLNDFRLIGKYHVPAGEFATLYSSRVEHLIGFPWGKNIDLNMTNGAPRWAWLSDLYPHVGVTDTELLAGQCDQFPVIIDSNTSIMDPPLIDAIERYVRAGGIFVTFVQTGRHSSTQPDSWPISKLTGYRVTAIDPHDENGVAHTRPVHLVAGQQVFSAADWATPHSFNQANGLSLQKVAPDCRDLMQWNDGAIAAGMRPFGKGSIFHIGVNFSNDKIWSGNRAATDLLFNSILRWAGRKREPAYLDTSSATAPAPANSEFDLFHRPGTGLNFRHYISNNGLYDVWTVWNMKNVPVSGTIHFTDIAPQSAIYVKTMSSWPIDKCPDGTEQLSFHLTAGETQNFLTPRNQLNTAARDWFDLQRHWWQGTTPPSKKPLPSIDSMRKFTVDLDHGWARRPLAESDDAALLASSSLDDSNWDRTSLDLTLLPLPGPTDPPHQILLRRQISVPASWSKGEISLNIATWTYATAWERMQVYCDGKLIRDWGDGVEGDTFDGLFSPGTTHLLSLVIQSRGCYLGIAGDAWLSYHPDPASSIDLAGTWTASDDAMTFDHPVIVPGPWNTWLARRTIEIPASHAAQNALLRIRSSGDIDGLIVNGRIVHPAERSADYVLNVTPWLHFGKPNEFILTRGGAPGKASIDSLTLDFYGPGAYP